MFDWLNEMKAKVAGAVFAIGLISVGAVWIARAEDSHGGTAKNADKIETVEELLVAQAAARQEEKTAAQIQNAKRQAGLRVLCSQCGAGLSPALCAIFGDEPYPWGTNGVCPTAAGFPSP